MLGVRSSCPCGALAPTGASCPGFHFLACRHWRRPQPLGCVHGRQASFTAKELREVLRLPGVRTSFPSGALEPTAADRAEMAASRVRRRIHEIMATAAAAPQPGCACCP